MSGFEPASGILLLHGKFSAFFSSFMYYEIELFGEAAVEDEPHKSVAGYLV